MPAAPSALGVHSAMFTPLGTYRKAMRVGDLAAEAARANGAIASSQGSATETPSHGAKFCG